MFGLISNRINVDNVAK